MSPADSIRRSIGDAKAMRAVLQQQAEDITRKWAPTNIHGMEDRAIQQRLSNIHDSIDELNDSILGMKDELSQLEGK